MRPNGVIHTHAVKLATIGNEVEEELYFLPDKQFHRIRNYIQTIAKKEE